MTEGEASLGAMVTNGPAAIPFFGRGSVVRPDRQDHHLIDGLGDPTAIVTLPCHGPAGPN